MCGWSIGVRIGVEEGMVDGFYVDHWEAICLNILGNF